MYVCVCVYRVWVLAIFSRESLEETYNKRAYIFLRISWYGIFLYKNRTHAHTHTHGHQKLDYIPWLLGDFFYIHNLKKKTSLSLLFMQCDITP
mmetsp:Transcript_21655/g.32225  ORF Transcript_21655/g.32225 Transcript_21655/m.32225 type:complete len:93 (+) Transcript_21655:596-874(+)